MDQQVVVALCTVGSDEEAERLAREVVNRRLAACVNVVGGVRSFYRWQGETCVDDELLLVIKTTAGGFDQLAQTLRRLHSYDLPEVLRIDVDGGDAEYLAWVVGGVGEKG